MTGLSRFAVVLVRPDSPENIGLAARGMANTGFADLRIVGLDKLEPPAWRTAIHAESIIEGRALLPVARRGRRRPRPRPRLDGPRPPRLSAGLPGRGRRPDRANIPAAARVGLVFGNERTGLTQDELGLANVRFHIPQASRQPSYNLGVAVTLTLHAIAFRGGPPPALRRDMPLDHAAQAEAGRRFRDMLDSLGFMHDTNRAFIIEKVQDIFFRMALTAKDRDVILAMFRKALEGPRERQATTGQERKGAPMNPKELKVVFGDNYKIDVALQGLHRQDRPAGPRRRRRDGPVARSIISSSRWPPAPGTTPWPSAGSARSRPRGWA